MSGADRRNALAMARSGEGTVWSFAILSKSSATVLLCATLSVKARLVSLSLYFSPGIPTHYSSGFGTSALGRRIRIGFTSEPTRQLNLQVVIQNLVGQYGLLYGIKFTQTLFFFAGYEVNVVVS
jgi:hypothetical protein